MGCLNESSPVLSEKNIYFYPTLDYTYDLELHNDTLYSAVGSMGVKVFKVLVENKMNKQEKYFVDTVHFSHYGMKKLAENFSTEFKI